MIKERHKQAECEGNDENEWDEGIKRKVTEDDGEMSEEETRITNRKNEGRIANT